MEHFFGVLGLSLFTILVEISIGMILFEVFYSFKNGQTNKRVISIAAICAIIGSLVSLKHLGYPFHVYYSIVNIETSWLSREILSVSTFTIFTIIYLFVSFKNQRSLEKIFGSLSAIVGIFTLLAMSNVYIYTSVPFWQTNHTYIQYYASAIALGAIFYSIGANIEYSSKEYVFLGAITIVSAGILAISYVFHGLSLANGNNVMQKSAEILYSYKDVMLLAWITGGLSIVLYYLKNFLEFIGFEKVSNNQLAINSSIISALLLTTAVLLAKLIFYSAMQTSTIGLQ